MYRQLILIILYIFVLFTPAFSVHIEYDVIPILLESYNQDAFGMFAPLNSHGHVAGQNWFNGGFFWSPENGTVPLAFPFIRQDAPFVVHALNNNDLIGGAVLNDSGAWRAAIWNCEGSLEVLGIRPDERTSGILDINQGNDAVGTVRLPSEESGRVFIRETDGTTIYIDYPGESCQSLLINDARQIAACFDNNLFIWNEPVGWTRLQLPDETADYRLLDIDETGCITALKSSNNYIPQTYQWRTPENPTKTLRNFTDINRYGQFVYRCANLNDFFDGLDVFSFQKGPSLPFCSLYQKDESLDFDCQTFLSFHSLNDQGQMLAFTIQTKKPYLFDPVRIVFDDPMLPEMIAAQLCLATEPSYADVLAMTALDANDANITSLAGLEYAANLQWLDVRDNPLDKKSVCYTLEVLRRRNPAITILYDADQYTDCSVEFGDPAVEAAVETELGIDEPNYFDMHASQFWELYLYDVSDLSGLEHATYLKTLWIQNSRVSDMSPIAGLFGVNFLLVERNESLVDISFIRELKLLEKLVLHGCGFSDIQSLLGLHYLTNLDLLNNPIDPISMCEVMPQVRLNNPGVHIRLSGNPAPLIDFCSSNPGAIWRLSYEWLREDCCEDTYWCHDADINRDGRVNLTDLQYVAYFWMKEDVYW